MEKNCIKCGKKLDAIAGFIVPSIGEFGFPVCDSFTCEYYGLLQVGTTKTKETLTTIDLRTL